MHTVCPDFCRQCYIIIDNKIYIIFMAKLQKFSCFLLKISFRKFFFPQLYKRHTTFQCFFHLIIQCFPMKPAAVCHRIKS